MRSQCERGVHAGVRSHLGVGRVPRRRQRGPQPAQVAERVLEEVEVALAADPVDELLAGRADALAAFVGDIALETRAAAAANAATTATKKRKKRIYHHPTL